MNRQAQWTSRLVASLAGQIFWEALGHVWTSTDQNFTRGRNSSVGSAWARCHSVAGSILLWGHFPVEGIFPLELTWVQTPFPQNSFGWEYKPRSSLCTHAFHRTDSKDPDVHVLDGWMPATKKHTQHSPSTKTECDYLNGWIKKRSHTQKSHPKMVNPRDIAGERKKKKKKKKKNFTALVS